MIRGAVHITGSNRVTGKGIVFKWRVEGQAHYPPSSEPCAVSPRVYLSCYEKKRNSAVKVMVCHP